MIKVNQSLIKVGQGGSPLGYRVDVVANPCSAARFLIRGPMDNLHHWTTAPRTGAIPPLGNHGFWSCCPVMQIAHRSPDQETCSRTRVGDKVDHVDDFAVHVNNLVAHVDNFAAHADNFAAHVHNFAPRLSTWTAKLSAWAPKLSTWAANLSTWASR